MPVLLFVFLHVFSFVCMCFFGFFLCNCVLVCVYLCVFICEVISVCVCVCVCVGVCVRL